MYDQTEQNLAPYNTAGQAAENQLLYGLGLSSGAPSAGGSGSAAASALASAPTSQSAKSFAGVSEGGISAQQAQAILSGQNRVQAAWSALPSTTQSYFGNDPNNYAAYWYNKYGQPSGYQIPTSSGGAATASQASTPATTGGIGQNSLIANFNPTEAQLQQTPGYQFTLDQGLKSTQAGAAARGLGQSGAAVKGAATYATGLADSTYQNQFNNYQTQQTNNFNRLLGLSGLGESAASQTGNFATATGANIGNNITGAGTATAAADTAAGSQISGLASNVGSAYLTNSLLQGSGGAGLYAPETGEQVYQDGLI